jgi:hypothetical protein
MEKQNNDDPTSKVQSEINALSTMDKTLTTIPEDVKEAEISSPIKSVENSLSQFVKDSFDVTRKDFEFNEAIQAEIMARLPEMKNTELIALLTNNKVNDNDRVSKILAPTFQLMTAKQNAEIQAAADAAKNGTTEDANKSLNMRSINESTPKDVLQGMSQLRNLLQDFMNKEKVNVDVKDAEVKEKK